MSKNWQRVIKRDRERAVELKRTLKRERKQAAAAAKAAEKNGLGPAEPGETAELDESANQDEPVAPGEPVADRPLD
jgi:hypothetical protein